MEWKRGIGSILFAAALGVGTGVVSSGASAAALAPVQMRCEFRSAPLGVDVSAPRLSWILDAGSPARRGIHQTAYQILVATSPALLAKQLGDLWNSEKVKSDQSLLVPYAGSKLQAAQEVFWKVRIWEDAGGPSPWSIPAEWTMGLLAPADWKAVWIGAPAGAPITKYPSVLLRKELNVNRGLKRALAFVCGLGQYEMTLNGAKVGRDLLAPGWTKYDKTCLYDTHDITTLLRPGVNAVGLFLGNGMYNVIGGRYSKFTGSFGPLKAIAQVRLEYKDGTVQTVGTDESWLAAPGPVTFDNPYGGEDYDARLEPQGWNQPGFTADWTAAAVCDGPGGLLKGISVANPPIRVFQTLEPVATKVLNSHTTVYDFGQNAAIIPRLTVKGAAGATLRLLPGELVNGDGSVDQGSSGGPSYWMYTLSGIGPETYFSPFFYRGCRYLQVETSAPAGSELPVVESLVTAAIHANGPPAGTFSTSNDLFNRIFSLVNWAQRNNMVSILTDCPHREKLGWLEQDFLNGPALRYNFDMAALFSKIMNDMADSQLPNGLTPNVAPDYVHWGGGDFYDSPEWSSALLLIPWQQYEFSGDSDLLRTHYEAMKRYVTYLSGCAKGNIVDFGLSDWYDIGPGEPGYSKLTPKGLTATAFYFQDSIILARAAKLLGKADDAARYDAQAAQIRASFNAKFFNATTHQYGSGSQTSNSMPLVMGIAGPAERTAVLENLVKDVEQKGLTAGDIGYRYLLRALADGGRSDVIYAMNNQSDKPGYGMQLARGATSLTEAWDAHRSSSQDHFMLGQINEWFYHDLAGIGCDPDGPGFKKIIIRPAIVGDLTHVSATYESSYGLITSGWLHDGRKVTMNISIPPNTTAVVYVPAANPQAVSESGKPASRALGVRLRGMENGAAIFNVNSGDYSFSSVEK